MTEYVLRLPYPPSVNHYWGRTRSGHTFIGAKGKLFRDEVCLAAKLAKMPELAGRLQCSVSLHPCDNRRRDIDNPLKALLDALTHSGVMADDSQIKKLVVEMGDKTDGGECVVVLSEVQK